MSITVVFFGAAVLATVTADNFHQLNNHRSSYILGGEEAKAHEYPFLVSLQIWDNYTGEVGPRYHAECGASIVNDRWIITAAHCFFLTPNGQNQSRWRVIAGAHNIKIKEPTAQIFNIEKAVSHPSYNDSTMQDDIMLIKIAGRFHLDDRTTAPIHLPSDHSEFDRRCCVTTGWGATGDDKRSEVVFKVNLPIDKVDICKGIFGHESVTDKHLCVGYRGSIFGVCRGDSGGPLFCLNDGVYTLVGITSFGVPWCDVGMHKVHTKVSSYRRWIDETLQLNGGSVP